MPTELILLLLLAEKLDKLKALMTSSEASEEKVKNEEEEEEEEEESMFEMSPISDSESAKDNRQFYFDGVSKEVHMPHQHIQDDCETFLDTKQEVTLPRKSERRHGVAQKERSESTKTAELPFIRNRTSKPDLVEDLHVTTTLTKDIEIFF